MLSNILHFLTSNLSKNVFKLSLFSIFLGFSFDVGAQEEVASAVSSEVAYILNTFLFLVCGFLVMFMAAGFAC